MHTLMPSKELKFTARKYIMSMLLLCIKILFINDFDTKFAKRQIFRQNQFLSSFCPALHSQQDGCSFCTGLLILDTYGVSIIY